MEQNNKKYGFTLVQAIFIIVVLGLLGGVMVKMFGVQSRTTTLSHQGIRAYYATKSALEWGTNQTLSDNDCTTVNNAGGWRIGKFNVGVNCTNQTYHVGKDKVNWFRLTANATSRYAGPESPDYVSRTLTMQIVNATD
ncbi:MAG: hypothetical protein ACOCZ2_00945 [Thermodesulfobacteriota bacterium]